MKGLERLAWITVIVLFLFFVRIKYQFTTSGSWDIQDWNNKLESHSLVETESMVE